MGHGRLDRSDDEESLQSLDAAIALGCNFFDTAWVYGLGHSERLLGEAGAASRTRRCRRHQDPAEEHAVAGERESSGCRRLSAPITSGSTGKSLENLGVETIDLQQFHVWADAWADDDGWQRAIAI